MKNYTVRVKPLPKSRIVDPRCAYGFTISGRWSALHCDNIKTANAAAIRAAKLIANRTGRNVNVFKMGE